MEWALAAIAVAVVFGVWLAYWRGRPDPVAALTAFARQRDDLAARFLEVARAAGTPRDLFWQSCTFDGDPILARDRAGGPLLALVPVTVGFTAVPGSDMEGHDGVARPRLASAVFAFRRGRWDTDGRAVFNLAPADALRLFGRRYEPIAAGR
jgi:hypothetical protein